MRNVSEIADPTPRIVGRWFVTPHAVERYIFRVRPGVGLSQARDEILQLAERAVRIRSAGDGIEDWRHPRFRQLFFRVNAKATSFRGDLPVLITVFVAGEDEEEIRTTSARLRSRLAHRFGGES